MLKFALKNMAIKRVKIILIVISIVISASGSTRKSRLKAPMFSRRSLAGMTDGVPPPRKMLTTWRSRASFAQASISRIIAAA